ncbi:MAG: right-handed parallel beta-helix repeat-containing protein [Candidatus Competibacter sp.]|nr:right-handed parallel beta-helix repeat-containing protein [Candidatus Competibacteraceae bacterium]
MRNISVLAFSLSLLTGAALADKPPFDCAKKSLASAVAEADDTSVQFTGICSGPIVIRTDGLRLTGVGIAVIDGAGQDAVTVAGAHGVSLTNIEVRNGANGVVGTNGAHLSLTDANIHDNQLSGISLQTASSGALSGVTVSHNGLHGLTVETGSAATITGSFSSSNNRVFGVNVNGSALTFSRADATVNNNAVGMQVATGANAFINDSSTSLNLTNNQAVGLTVVSGAHMVSFGGAIKASGNPVNGVTLNSKAGLDLDAGSTLESFNNGDGLQVQQNSEMTVFNTPQFSGVSGFSAVNCHNNRGNGIRIRNASSLKISNQAKVISTGNGANGLVADDGADIVLVNSTVTGNAIKDLQLTFGSRADLQTSTVGTFGCDATVLVRGTSGITCPQ